jgi:opacity protein-like surface antigen
MRSISVAALACAICLALSGGAQATPRSQPDPEYVYYAADAGWFSAQGSRAGTFNAGVGFRFNKHYAIEAGYEGVFLQGIAINGGYVDAYGYLPLGRRSSVLLFATAGASYVDSVYINGRGYSASAFGVRGGGGIEWKMSDTWAVRAAVRYQTTVIDAVTVTAGFTLRL